MDNSSSSSDFSPTIFGPVTFKDCDSEMKRQGLERLLTAVYKREVGINLLLVENGASQTVLDSLKHRNIANVADSIIGEIKAMIGEAEGTERRCQIMERYYGLDGMRPTRLSALATRFNISRERVRQIKERSLISLRYRKREIERLIVEHSSRLLSRRAVGLQSSEALVGELEPRNLCSHEALLMMHESTAPWTIEQSAILNAVDSYNRARIVGCAGSGKTILALTLARRYASAGERTVLTCFSRALADWLSSLLQGQENLEIMSFHSLCFRVAKQAGIKVPGGWNNRVWLEKFPDTLSKAIKANPSLKFDNIIVDDGQDFRDNWWLALQSAIKPRGRLLYFVDDNKLCNPMQNEFPEIDFDSHLSINLRSPAIISQLLRVCHASERPMRYARSLNAPLEFYRCDTDDEVKSTLSHVFVELVEKGRYQGCDVAVLTPRIARFSSVANHKLRCGARLVRSHSDMPANTLLSRSHAFKGFERKCIVLVDLDKKFAVMNDDEIRIFVYETFSRFTERLIILGDVEVWNRIVSLSPPNSARHYAEARERWLDRAADIVPAVCEPVAEFS
ncbi:hypothetical protein KF728_05290 [Candidatus Obscuribacterales bacterium]|nr:hypothetical protein [Candidatus Obscuribacterales bacterium]